VAERRTDTDAGRQAVVLGATIPGYRLSVAAIALSAFLLFTLELLAGRLVLPVFGGTPGVWATTLSFFTAVLFLGYVYAHLVATRLSPRTGGRLHLGVAILALAALVFSPTQVDILRQPGLAEPINVLLAQALLVGPPAFLLATTTPLLSAWYGRRGGDAWWFYAASNAASMAGLLAYPLLIEPRLGLGAQRLAVTIGLAVFVLLIGLVVVRSSRAPEPTAPGMTAAVPAPPSLAQQAAWLIAAFAPAGLLAATTNFITTDLVSAPLLWVGPLGIYLASFVVAFSERGRRLLPAINLLLPLAAMFLFFPFAIDTSGAPPWALLASELLAFGVVATGIHGRLALHRPDERYLTRFYLILSAGGMLATAFVALIAPVVFSNIYEYPILILIGLAVPILLPRARKRNLLEMVGISVIASLLVAWVSTADQPFLQRRSFFGVIRLDTTGVITLEFHGSTLHGVQFLEDGRRREPTTYYVRQGPLGDAFADLRARLPRADVGVVGLGVGTAAAYAQPSDTFAFFEIDRTVAEIAEDPTYLTYLTDAAVRPRVVIGDARLSLADEPAASLDLLVLDAFSSDAVPAHLLTQEAMGVYRRLVRPGGLIVFHVSNRYYDLAAPVAATAESLALDAAMRVYFPPSSEIARIEARVSIWVAVGSPADVGRLRGLGSWKDAGPGPVLTDDFADLLRVLHLGGA
jgi:SAM-dependent methyltransferase